MPTMQLFVSRRQEIRNPPQTSKVRSAVVALLDVYRRIGVDLESQGNLRELFLRQARHLSLRFLFPLMQ